jgi:hypothetical protein
MTQSDEPTSNTPAPASPLATSSFSLEQYHRERLENVRRQLPPACRQLKDVGVARIHIEYDGYGDSGQVESITYLASDGGEVDTATKVEITSEALMDLFYDLLEQGTPVGRIAMAPVASSIGI